MIFEFFLDTNVRSTHKVPISGVGYDNLSDFWN